MGFPCAADCSGTTASRMVDSNDASPLSINDGSTFTGITYPSSAEFTPSVLKQWKGEIKRQEENITAARRNALNPEEQVAYHFAPQTESDSVTSHGPYPVPRNTHPLACQPTEANNDVHENTDWSTNDVVFAIGSRYNLTMHNGRCSGSLQAISWQGISIRQMMASHLHSSQCL